MAPMFKYSPKRKIFTVDAVFNRRDDRELEVSKVNTKKDAFMISADHGFEYSDLPQDKDALHFFY